MPGQPEFLQQVGGGSGTAIATNASGTVETDNYQEGGGFDYDGTAYPYTIDPAEFIQFLHITDAGDVDAEVTTSSGTTFTIPLAGGTGVIDWIEIDSVTFRDPNGTSARLAGSWGGE